MATTATPTPRPSPLRPLRRDAPERWQAAAVRAVSEGITVRQLAGSGAWVATSGSDATAAYLLTLHSCECQAGEFGDPVCKHRAALRRLTGHLDDPEPEPPTPAAIVPIRQPEAPCPACRGDGWWYGSERDCAHTVITCFTCRGTGVDPATLIAA